MRVSLSQSQGAGLCKVCIRDSRGVLVCSFFIGNSHILFGPVLHVAQVLCFAPRSSSFSISGFSLQYCGDCGWKRVSTCQRVLPVFMRRLKSQAATSKQKSEAEPQQTYLDLLNLTLLQVLIVYPNMEFIRTLQKSRFWQVEVDLAARKQATNTRNTQQSHTQPECNQKTYE